VLECRHTQACERQLIKPPSRAGPRGATHPTSSNLPTHPSHPSGRGEGSAAEQVAQHAPVMLTCARLLLIVLTRDHLSCEAAAGMVRGLGRRVPIPGFEGCTAGGRLEVVLERSLPLLAAGQGVVTPLYLPSVVVFVVSASHSHSLV